jgi:hypothetical protein
VALFDILVSAFYGQETSIAADRLQEQELCEPSGQKIVAELAKIPLDDSDYNALDIIEDDLVAPAVITFRGLLGFIRCDCFNQFEQATTHFLD